jgi:hypothetical protein
VEETGEKNTDLPQVTDKLDHRHDITEILLKVALNALLKVALNTITHPHGGHNINMVDH